MSLGLNKLAQGSEMDLVLWKPCWQVTSHPADMAAMGYSDPDAFWQSVIDGQTNIWTMEVMGDFFRDLLSASLADQNLYTMLLLYTNGNCDAVPGGCPPGMVLPTPTPPSSVCPAPFIQTGPIQVTGGSGDGGKIAPPNPVVIGQDPERRGVDVKVNALIPPSLIPLLRNHPSR